MKTKTMTSKSIKKQILKKTLTVKFNLEDSFNDYAMGNITFPEFMEIIEESGDRLSLAYDAYLKDQEIEEGEDDPMAYEYWREREEDEEREAMIQSVKESLERD